MGAEGDKQEPEQLLKPVVFVSSELGEVIEKDDGAQPEDDGPGSEAATQHSLCAKSICCHWRSGWHWCSGGYWCTGGHWCIVAIGAAVAFGAEVYTDDYCKYMQIR